MQEIYLELRQQVLGGHTVGYYVGFFFFCLLGTIISLYASSRKREVGAPDTPTKFSWLFLFWDNTKRVVVTFILMYLVARAITIDSIWLMVGAGVTGTLFFDQLLAFFIDQSKPFKKLLSMNRDNFPTVTKNE